MTIISLEETGEGVKIVDAGFVTLVHRIVTVMVGNDS